MKAERYSCRHYDVCYGSVFEVGGIQHYAFAMLKVFVPHKSDNPAVLLVHAIGFGCKYRLTT